MLKEKIVSIALLVLIIIFIPIFLTTIMTGVGRVSKSENTIEVKINYDGREQVMDIEQYLVGVVAAEMPANFELEALKAQAVAARTYTLKRTRENPDIVFTNKIQSYASDAQLEEQWSVNDYPIHYAKIKEAVQKTRGVVMTYENELIDAVFHSTSTGMTQSAEDVWGQAIPYLQPVESLEDINAPSFIHQYDLTKEDFIQMIKSYDSAIEIGDHLSNELQIIERNKQGYVKKIQVGNKILSGEVFRKVLGLASTNFSITHNLSNLEIICKGFGHGVGLSQYGAEALAIEGYGYKEILKYYYKDILIKNEY